MPLWLIILIPSVVAHAVMWPVITRLHFRNYPWDTQGPGPRQRSTAWCEGDQLGFSGMLGFFWPLTAFFWGFVLVCRGVGQFAKMPSKQEKRELRLKDIKREITEAERDYARVCADLERIKNDRS